MSTPVVTIVIPVYNGQAVVADAVSDVFAQDYGAVELIVVNDGSSDDSSSVLNSLSVSVPASVSMRIAEQENLGICAARNAGIDLASGDFIAFMDQDDRIPPDYISSLVSSFEEDTQVVIGGSIDSYASGKLVYRNLNESCKWSMYRNTAPWGRIFRKALIDEHSIRFTDMKISEDFYFNFLFLSYCRAGQVKIVPQSGYRWTIDEHSESHGNMSRIAQDRDVTVMLSKLMEDMKSIESDSALDSSLFEYLVIKHVMWYLLFVSGGADKDSVRGVYTRTMDWLKGAFPSYRKNPHLRRGPEGESFKIRFIVKTAVLMDRLGLLLPFLILR